MKRQTDKNSVRHTKRPKESLSSRRNYRNHESSRDNGRETRDDKYSSNRSYSRQKPSSRERDVHLSPDPYRDGNKRDTRERKTEKTFRTLAVENFSSQISNEDIEESLYFEYRKFGDVSVRVVESHGNRIAYVTYKYPECAADAKNAKGALVMHDRRLIVEAVYERKTSGHQSEKKYDSDHYDRKNKDLDMRERRDRRSKSISPVRQRRSRSHSPVRSSRYNDNGERIYNKRSSPRYDDRRKQSIDYDEDTRYSNNSPENNRGAENDLLPEEDAYATRTLHIGNLEGHVSHGNLKRIFDQYGRIDDIDIKHSGRGTQAYIRFANLDDAYKAKVNMDGRTVLDNVIKIGYGKPILSSKLWIGGLGSGISLGTLEREFDRFGSIRKIDYERGTDFAFVLYDSLDAAREACSQMRGTTMPGSDIRLRIDFADPAPGLPGWDEWENRKSEREREERSRGNNDRYQNDRRFQRGGRGRNNGFEGRGRYDRKFRDDRFNRGNRHGGYNRRRSPSPFDRNNEDKFAGPEIDPQLLFKQAQAKGVVDLHQLCEVFNPPLWDGCIIAKKTAFAVRFFALDGNVNVLYNFLENNTPENNIDHGTFLNMEQKLRLEEDPKLNIIEKHTATFSKKWCLLLAVPGMPTIVNIAGGKNAQNIFTKQRPLRGLVRYFKDKKAAGVVTMSKPIKNADPENAKENKYTTEVMYAFPPSKFAKAKLYTLAPNLNEEVIIDEYLLVVIIRSSQSR